MIISISGRSGSGKTTVIDNLIKALGRDNIAYLHQDSYYKDQRLVPYEKRSQLNYDHPETIDIELFTEHLINLSKGKIVQKPIYNYKTHTREKTTEIVYPNKIILADGIHVFFTNKLRDLANIKVYVDVSKDICFIRRLLRDTQERGRSVESVINQYIETVRPMQEKYVSPTIKYADFIIKDGGQNTKDIEQLVRLINAKFV
jgi:uridine kinase